MTDFPQTKQTSTRVRDNQRRSRARKKEYLQDLERRVRQAEQQGVQASAAIQAAARQVAEENQKLRQLLRHHGVNDRHIETYLSSGVVVVPPGDSRVQPGGAGCTDAIHLTTSPGTPRGLHPSIVPRRVPTRSCASSPPPPPPSTDENNCSMAADLISTMTGANPHQVRTSLGCAPGTDCHVDNTKISNAIEQLTMPPAVQDDVIRPP